jgi:hypothetical protein
MAFWQSPQSPIMLTDEADALRSDVKPTIEGTSRMTPREAQHKFVVKQFDAALKKCEREGISPELVVQTILSLGITMAIAFQDQEDAARLLEGLAAAVRRGDITHTEH